MSIATSIIITSALPNVTFPNLREGVLCFNSQIVLLENSKVSKVFGCNFFRVKSQVIKLVFGLALSKSLVSFRGDVVQGLAQMRIGTKSIWIVVQAGWSSVVSPLEGLDQHHLSLGCEV